MAENGDVIGPDLVISAGALPITGTRLAENARTAGLPPARLREADDMEHAVTTARALATPGALILLSPAAPSYNTYPNFEARGDHFAPLAMAAR